MVMLSTGGASTARRISSQKQRLVVDVDAQVVEPFGGIPELHISLFDRA